MSEFPKLGRLAGIDYGHVRIGIAVCDADRTLASPLETYQRQSPAADLDYFRRLAAEEQLVGFVIGLPIHGDGHESQKSIETRDFSKWLHQGTGLPIRMFDERFTSALAKRMLLSSGLSQKKRKQKLDRVAAQLILSAYLESPHQADTAESL